MRGLWYKYCIYNDYNKPCETNEWIDWIEWKRDSAFTLKLVQEVFQCVVTHSTDGHWNCGERKMLLFILLWTVCLKWRKLARAPFSWRASRLITPRCSHRQCKRSCLITWVPKWKDVPHHTGVPHAASVLAICFQSRSKSILFHSCSFAAKELFSEWVSFSSPLALYINDLLLLATHCVVCAYVCCLCPFPHFRFLEKPQCWLKMARFLSNHYRSKDILFVEMCLQMHWYHVNAAKLKLISPSWRSFGSVLTAII